MSALQTTDRLLIRSETFGEVKRHLFSNTAVSIQMEVDLTNRGRFKNGVQNRGRINTN